MNRIIKYLKDKYGMPVEMAERVILPELGEEFIVRGIVYKVSYIKHNPIGFSGVPVGIAQAVEKNANMKGLRVVQWFKEQIQKLKRS